MKQVKENIILTKTFDFAVRIVELNKYLVQEKKENVLSKQILRSGTSVGANAEEGAGGYSKKDFAAKMSISYKEARETHYWLRLLNATNYINEKQYNSLIEDCNEILKILYSIIKSSNN